MSLTFQAAARRVMEEQSPHLPDLSGVLVLIPNHHLILPFLAALRGEIGQSVFLPPRFATLPDLAAGVSNEVANEEAEGAMAGRADSLRLLELHAFLARMDWLDKAALWPLARAMQDVLDEMDAALLSPPAGFADFARQVEAAARRALSAPLELEARLIFDLWRAFHSAGPGGAGEYALRLSRWLETHRGPIYALGLHGLSRLEERFLARCEAQAGLVRLPVMPRHPARRHLFDTAWSLANEVAEEAPPLCDRAAGLAALEPDSPVAGVVRLQGAPDLEGEASLVAEAIVGWLAEGRRAIGVVALDRMAARRLRAILERQDILMQDETGWTFSTASVSHVLDRWLALLLDGFYHRDLLDFLKSPYVFSDLDEMTRQEAVVALEEAIRAASVVEGLDRFVALAETRARAALPMLQRLAVAERRFRTPRRRPIAAWLETLLAALDFLGATPAFEADQAGRQLMARLRALSAELAGGPEGERRGHTLAEWRAWLNLQLDRDTFRESDIDSPLRLTHLAALRLRDFDALVILGADSAHLPDAGEDAVFNDALRAQLGLPGRHTRRAETLEALSDALSRADRVLITWQERRDGGPNPPSPWIEALDLFHRLAYGRGLRQPWSGGADRPGGEAPSVTNSLTNTPAGMPAPRVDALPSRLSASAWQDLVSCPYRWFARQCLGLGEEDQVAEEMEKSDYGELVHAILSRFHTLHPVLAGTGRDELSESLGRLGREAFAARESGYYLARAWRLRWERHADAYLDWAIGWEAAGHAWREAEVTYARELDLGDGLAVTLHGRLDRLDDGPAGTAVLDYKTQSRQVLSSKVKAPGEQVQLSFYGLLTGAAEAALVGLDDDKVMAHALARPLAEAAGEEGARLAATLSAIGHGAPLPAHGAAHTCLWCEMRGLCRRDWFDVPDGNELER